MVNGDLRNYTRNNVMKSRKWEDGEEIIYIGLRVFSPRDTRAERSARGKSLPP